jgi:hypothetical protein
MRTSQGSNNSPAILLRGFRRSAGCTLALTLKRAELCVSLRTLRRPQRNWTPDV